MVVPWLPAASRADLERAVGWLIERWLADWIAAPDAFAVTTPPAGEAPAGVSAGDDDLVALGLVACAGRADPANAIDRCVLLRVGADMRDDLAVRMGGAGSDGRCGAHRFTVSPRSGTWSLTLSVDEEALVALRKRCAGVGRMRSTSPLRRALVPETVSLGCHLGEAAITAAELAALGAGDVLVFDRVLADAVPLTVEGRVSRSGRAVIAARHHAIEVRLTQPISLQEM